MRSSDDVTIDVAEQARIAREWNARNRTDRDATRIAIREKKQMIKTLREKRHELDEAIANGSNEIKALVAAYEQRNGQPWRKNGKRGNASGEAHGAPAIALSPTK